MLNYTNLCLIAAFEKKIRIFRIGPSLHQYKKCTTTHVKSVRKKS